MPSETSSKLVLEDGSIFYGKSFGAESSAGGEVVFNTGMVGYPESMTDPSYRGQILVLTYPLIGNYGIPGDDREEGLLKYFESEGIQVKGLVVSDYSAAHSHWNSARSLAEWMKEQGIPGIYGVDTRELTKKIRTEGTMLGKIVNGRDIGFMDPNTRNLVKEVTVSRPKEYGSGRTRIMLVDCGIKNNIIRSLVERKTRVVRVPYDYDFTKEKFDGLFISNGPGDPKMCVRTIANVRKALEMNIPTFGICLGNQILALAAGADTYKMKFGHRSQNQPCIEVGTRRCYITSQNHGYAVDRKTLPKEWEEWFVNANDKTNEGIRHKSRPFMSCQFHPEATPGPLDTRHLFDRFMAMVDEYRGGKQT